MYTHEPQGEIDIFDPGGWENNEGPRGWYAIGDDNGLFAYAADLMHALVIRDLARIRAKANGNLEGKSGTNGNVENYISGGVVR